MLKGTDTNEIAARDSTPRGGIPADSAPPKAVLLVHNAYQQPGGEDQAFLEEASLLEARGHRVVRHEAHNDSLAQMGRAELLGKTLWNQQAYRALRATIRRERPDVVHFHNTFPLISPSGYYAAAAEGVPVVQTLHNYRLLCPNGLFFRQGAPCEDCLGESIPWPGVAHGCYRESRTATGAVATMLSAHRAAGTWKSRVDAYVALTLFAREKFVAGGLPEDKIFVKPNFVSRDAGTGSGGGGYALFVGRLSREKGVGTLLRAWERMGDGAVGLRIVGDGPLSDAVARAAEKNPRIGWLGRRPQEEVRALMQDAGMLVFPSECYETFGKVVVESFSAGTPVVVARDGATAELVEPGRTGLHFRTGDPVDLANEVTRLAARPHELARMRRNARAEFERKYSAARNYAMLTDIYARVIEGRAA